MRKLIILNVFIYSVIRQIQERSRQCNIDDFNDYIIPLKLFHIPTFLFFITYSHGQTYIVEIIRNASIRWEEHNDPTKKSEVTG